jgi:hypothetical protein
LTEPPHAFSLLCILLDEVIQVHLGSNQRPAALKVC